MRLKNQFAYICCLVLLFSCELEEKTFIRPVPQVKAPEAITNTSFVAKWHTMLGADKYYLDVATDDDFTNILVGYNNKQVLDTLEYIDELDVRTTYFYRVRAERNQIYSDNSEVMQLVTLGFDDLHALPAIELTQTGFVARWEPLDGAKQYQVELSTTPDFASVSKHTSDMPSFRFEALASNQDYYYRVRAVSNSLSSAPSNTIHVATPDFDAVVALEASQVETFQFIANWEAAPGAEEYLVELARNGNFSGDVISQVTTALHCVFTDLRPNQHYAYRVFAKRNAAVSGLPSREVWVLTAAIARPVLKPVTNHKVFGFTVNWEPVSNATSYVVQVATDPDFENKVRLWLPTTGTELTVEGLKYDQTYYYRVRARHIELLSDWSDTARVDPIADQCRLERTAAKWFPWNYEIDFTYNDKNLLVAFTESRREDIDDRSFSIEYDNAEQVKKVSIYAGLTYQHLRETWVAHRQPDGRLHTWEVRNAAGDLLKLRVHVYANNRLEGLIDYADMERTEILASRELEYYGDDVPWGVFLNEERELHFNSKTNALHPFNLINKDLVSFIRSQIGTSYSVLPETCFGFEVISIPTSVSMGYHYDLTYIGLPKLSFSQVGVEFIYNAGCPIDKPE